jgi:putative SOS response-associated peptidase YedK
MCDRFTLTHREARALAAELGASVDDLLGCRPRYKIAPTDDHWIVRTRYEDCQVLPAKWGLINFWMTDRKQAEPFYSNATKSIPRCLSTSRA